MLTSDTRPRAADRPQGRHLRRGMRPLLHPTERSRFALALVTTGTTMAAGTVLVVAWAGMATLAGLVGGMLLVGASVWLSLQLLRSHLLGHAARVSPDNLPEVQAALDEIRDRLGYHRPIDVYVIDKVESHALLMKFLSTRVLLLDGDFVAGTLSPERQAELTFLIARFVGALKAKHMRLQPVRLAISAVEKLMLLNPFLYPYERATVYSGDQIGLACCGDLRAALRVLGGFMVGVDLAPRLGFGGVLMQAVDVRHRRLPRLRQLMLTHPHLTNRYLNLLAFAERHDWDGFAAFEAGLDDATRRALPAALARAPGADRGGRVLALAATLAVVAALVVVLLVRTGPPVPADVLPADDGTVPTSIQPPPTGPPPTDPAPAADPAELARAATASASSTAPDSVDSTGEPVGYDAANVTDGDPATAWRTPGDGRGETVTLTWDRPVRVLAVGLVPGYDKHDPADGTDRFPQNRRVRTARVHVADGSAWDVELADSRELQSIRLDRVTDTVTIEVLDTVPGEPGFDYTAISEISVVGVAQ